MRMHGLINTSLQSFVADRFGAPAWARIADQAGVPGRGFEAMLVYDNDLTHRVLEATAADLSRPVETVLEDLGIYLITHPRFDAVRRLLRFGGTRFPDFLQSLNDLHGRVALALPELDPPRLTLRREIRNSFVLRCRWHLPLSGHVMIGLLRSMADDYGVLVYLDHRGLDPDGAERIGIQILDPDFTPARSFDLVGATA